MIKNADTQFPSAQAISHPPTHACRCSRCRYLEDHPDKQLHHQLNLLLSHLSEQQRRWVAAYEARRIGWGGQSLVSLITGLSRGTIIRGQQELDTGLKDRPFDRTRVPGAGRHPKLKEAQLKRLEDLLSEGATAYGWQCSPSRYL